MTIDARRNRLGKAAALAILTVVLGITMVGPARADDDRWEHRRHHGHGHDHDGFFRGGVFVGPGYAYAPGYYYAPPPRVYVPPPVYYVPPPVYYAPPAASLNLVFPLRIH